MTYAKSALALVVAVVSAIVAALTGDNYVDAVEWVNVGIALVTAAAVFAAPNVPGANYTKAILAVLMAVFTFFTSTITGGVTTSEWLQVLVIVAGAIGVFAVPNTPTAPTVTT